MREDMLFSNIMINLKHLDWVVFLDPKTEDEELPFKAINLGHLAATGKPAVDLKNQKCEIKYVSPDRLRVVSEYVAKRAYESAMTARYSPLLRTGATKSQMKRQVIFNPHIY